MVCTFFGHHYCPAEVKGKLREVLVELIEKQSARTFYVGNHGAFDGMVHSTLRELKECYPEINYAVVLAYLPQNRNESEFQEDSDTLFPEEIESAPKRFAISRRNQWMLRQSDTVVAYLTHSWGGAAQFVEMAERQKKTVIRL